MQVEQGSSNFIMKGNCYYSYFDIISQTSISRYYLVALPNDNILLQFVLSTDDTSIDYSTNIDVINMITSIEKENSNQTGLSNSVDENSVMTNDLSNSISNNMTANNVYSENEMTNAISNSSTNNNINSDTSSTTPNNNNNVVGSNATTNNGGALSNFIS